MFSIMHISDIHFREGKNWITDKAGRLARAAIPFLQDTTDVLLLVSGDVAFSGKESEYANAQGFLGEVQKHISDVMPGIRIHVRAIPGNHDCDFTKNNELRETVIDALVKQDKASTAGKPLLEQCLVPQDCFWSFEAGVSGHRRDVLQRCGYLDVLQVGELRVEVLGLNSAWLSHKNEMPGTLAVPDISLKVPQDNADFRIAMIHHPANWQAPGSARDFRDFILDGVDILLVGHEHAADITELGRPNAAGILVQDAPALQREGPGGGFAVLRVDLANHRLERRVFTWKGSTEAYEVADPHVLSLERVGRAAHSRARPKKSFMEYVRDPGATFTHPRSESIRLEDIFVWPEIDVRPFRRLLDKTALSFRGGGARKRLSAMQKVIIEGTERCGRTSLAKMLAQDLLAAGKTVLLLDGAKLESASAEQFLRQCERAYRSQYDGPGLEAVRQANPADVAVLVDDFDACKLGVANLVRVLQSASRMFGHVAVFVSDLFGIHELFTREALPELLDFQHVLLTDFGHSSRRELIERWYSLGIDLLTETDFESAVAEAERFISSHIGRGLFPSYPICVLTLLQAYDAGTNADLSAGAYGAIYEALLQSALNRYGREVPVEFLQTFLSEVAMQMLTVGAREMTLVELESLATRFMRTTLNDFRVDEITRCLTEARMLVIRENTVRFRYPHIYYLSCAKALQLHKQDPARRMRAAAELERLFDALHSDASANIMMFYLHFSRDLESVATLVDITERLFVDRPMANPLTLDLGGELPWPMDLLGDIEADQGESIKRYRTAQDEADRTRQDFKSDDERLMAHLNKYHKCIKAMHLIGQVIRSFPGTLPRDLKVRAARAVVAVSLRALTDFADTLRSTRTQLRAAIVDYLVTVRRVRGSQGAMDEADTAIFYLALGAGHGLIRRAALALGSSHILPTLDVLREEALGPGCEIVDMAIRLDHARDRADVKDALRVKERMASSGFAGLIVRQLIMDFLSTFRLPTGLRAKFISAFELDSNKRLLPVRGEMILGHAIEPKKE